MQQKKRTHLFFIFQTISLNLYCISFSIFSHVHVKLAAHDQILLVVVCMRDTSGDEFAPLGGVSVLADCTKSVIYPLGQWLSAYPEADNVFYYFIMLYSILEN